MELRRDLDRLVLSGDDSSQLNKLKFSGGRWELEPLNQLVTV